MRNNMIFVALCALFFSAFHDSLMPLFETQEHTSVVHCQSDSTLVSDTHGCDECKQIHNILHFIAIVVSAKEVRVRFVKQERFSHIPHAYAFALQKSSYKPPTV